MIVDLASAGQRRFRGYGKQLLVIVNKVVAANIRAILNWLKALRGEPRRPDQPAHERPKQPGFEAYLPEANGPPYLVGPPMVA